MSKKRRKGSSKCNQDRDRKETQSVCSKTGVSPVDPLCRREFIRLAALSTAGLSLPFAHACGDDDDGAAAGTGAMGPTGGTGAFPGAGGTGAVPATGGGVPSGGVGGTVTGGTGAGPAGAGPAGAGPAGVGGGPAGAGGGPAGAGGGPAGSGGSPAGTGGGPAGTGGGPAGTGGGPAGTGGAAGEPPPPPLASTDVILARYEAGEAPTGEAAVRLVLAEMDFSWLSPGDSVFIKVACNSGDPHPATTSPQAIRGLVAELLERGAGRVIMGDKAGVEHVTLFAGDQRSGSTRQLMQSNGLLAAAEQAGGEAHFFDDQGFDSGYFQATPPQGNHWPRGLWIPNIVQEVDHIVYVPRLGYHTLAGCTLGLKSAVGWLRDDSRHDMHTDAAAFYAKYTEVNYVDEILSRYRMTISLSEKLLLHNGPDLGMGGVEYTAEPPIVIASASLANHDAVAASVLLHFAQVVPGMGYTAAGAVTMNAFFPSIILGWTSSATPTTLVAHAFEQSVSQDGALTRAWELDGGRPDNIPVIVRGQAPDAAMQGFMDTHGEGLYQFS